MNTREGGYMRYILDDSFDGKKLQYIQIPQKMNVDEVIKNLFAQIDRKIEKRASAKKNTSLTI